MKVMSSKFFLILLFCLTYSCFSAVETRELSIQQLEERKKLDLERKKRIEKKGRKSFQNTMSAPSFRGF